MEEGVCHCCCPGSLRAEAAGLRQSWQQSQTAAGVVDTAPFSLFLLRKHFITEKNLKKKSGDVNDEANFSLFILLHKRAKPMLPPCVHFSNHKLIITLYSPLISISHIQICYQLLQTRPTGEKRYQLLQTAHTFTLRPPIPTQPTFNPSVCPVTTVERMDVEPNTKKNPP